MDAKIYPDDGFESLRDQAITLRRQGFSRRAIRDRLHIHNNDLLNRLLKGEPPPEWTKRPNAKDDLKEEARRLRRQGWTYDRIQMELGCAQELHLPLGARPAETRQEARA
jgi:orotate phosphoribosyltransferase-like protein